MILSTPYLLSSQNSPSYPEGQEQTGFPFPSLEQDPPFWHGLGRQGNVSSGYLGVRGPKYLYVYILQLPWIHKVVKICLR